MRSIASVGLALVPLVCAAGCQGPYEISRDGAERVLRTLASDDMAGRSAFGPEIARAAEFLAQEFADAGLQPLPSADSYLQTFPVYGVRITDVAAEVGGRTVPDDHLAITLGTSEESWVRGDGRRVVRLGPEDDSGGILQAMQGEEGSALVLVDERHASLFRRIRAFLARPQYRLDPDPRPSVVLALVDDVAATRYRVEVRGAPDTLELANVVGRVEGHRPDEIVLFAAHYDHIGVGPAVDGDSISNGANDNASGTTAVVELARYFATRPRPERTLLFAAFTAEEVGGFGSRYFSAQLDPDEIVAMFNIEMIGKPGVEGANTAWITGWDRSSFGEILAEAVEGTPYRFHPDPYPEQNLFYRSDNATLARLGVPAHSISTTPIDVDTDYHQVTDEVETLDLDHLTRTIRAIASGAEPIVSGRATPSRVTPRGSGPP